MEVRHLPKMDTVGKCDPQVKVTMSGVTFKTKFVPNVYTTKFEEKFDFDAGGFSVQSEARMLIAARMLFENLEH